MTHHAIVRRQWTWLLAALVIAAASSALFAQAPSFTEVGKIPGPANLIEVDGNRGFMVGGKTLTVLDLSNPAAPVKQGSYAFPEKIWGIRVVGSLVYVAADFYGLGIVDVSNPKAPTLKGSVKLAGQAKNVAVFGTTALVADHMSGLDIVDISNLSKPVRKDSYFLEGYARDVIGSGSMAYAIDAPAGLYTFDMSKQGPIEPVASEQSARAPSTIEVSKGVAVLIGGGMLQLYDLSKPTAPVKAGTLRMPSGRPVRVNVLGSRAYVADGRDGLQVVDLSNLSSPSILGGFKTSEPARDVAATDSYIYLVVGAGEEEGEILILKRS